MQNVYNRADSLSVIDNGRQNSILLSDKCIKTAKIGRKHLIFLKKYSIMYIQVIVNFSTALFF